ncbi:hypothetical protein E2C01_066022 [Portunus trituberculatus]|uniref:Uncharacterized protein n=1 Tax=Portunus trituberculatus TaxID=210409 RepID=A0A5B7HP68_PORTR|nr:hypothetical protein [Portunus trituberculatus]
MFRRPAAAWEGRAGSRREEWARQDRMCLCRKGGQVGRAGRYADAPSGGRGPGEPVVALTRSVWRPIALRSK